MFSPGLKGPGNPLNPDRAWDRELQLSLLNVELSASHQLALITSLPFVHTARCYYRLNGLMRSSDWAWIGHPWWLSLVREVAKLTKLECLKEVYFMFP